jgi:hypothetical protein
LTLALALFVHRLLSTLATVLSTLVRLTALLPTLTGLRLLLLARLLTATLLSALALAALVLTALILVLVHLCLLQWDDSLERQAAGFLTVPWVGHFYFFAMALTFAAARCGGCFRTFAHGNQCRVSRRLLLRTRFL